ncbi:MAG: hypothetical protein LBR68_05165 [Lachnoclostridium sp.]|nr:hypothetical protein [Lachnoclostridium sp.]
MAKKDKNKKKKNGDENLLENEEKGGSKLVTMLIVLIIVAIWLAVFGVLIKLDIGSFGSEILSPLLKDIPVINRILPETTNETVEEYEYSTMEDAMSRIRELEGQLAVGNDTGEANASTIENLQKEIDRLKEFEQNQLAFAQREKEFNEKVVFGDGAPDIEEYKAFYEGIKEADAAEIYERVVKQQQYDQNIQKQADIYSSMKPENAAVQLEEMTSDLDLLAAIFDSMSESEAGLIMENMSPNAAAQITTKMTRR